MRRSRSPGSAAGRLLPALAVSCLSLPLVLAAVARPAAAERPAAAFGERVDVVLVEVEAVVVDRQGRRISGLGRGDFRLLVDGEPVEIDVFEEVHEGQVALAAAGGAEAPASEAAADGAAPPAAPTDSAAPPSITRWLVFVDQYIGSVADRHRVVERLRGDLALLPPDDPMAVVAWNGRRVEILTPWTTDRERLDRVLRIAGRQRGPRAAAERHGAVTEEQHDRRLAEQLEATYVALTATLQGFSGGSGRSVALLVAGGWRFDPGAGSGRGVRSRLAPDTRKMVRRLAEVANASGYTLYPIDAPGAQLDPSLTAAVAGLGDDAGGGLQATAEGAAGLDRMERAFDRAWSEFDGEATLLLLARETGGVALINGQRMSALRQAVADLSSYYRLGFYHSSEADGAVRRIEVEVARPALRVRSRRSFVDLTTATRAGMALDQALLLGAAKAEPLRVRLGTARPAGWRRVRVPIEVEIPMGRVTVRAARHDRVTASLELHVAVEDRQGRRNTIASLPIEIETAAEAAAGRLVWEGSLTLRDQDHEVLFALSDPPSGQVFVGRAGFEGGARR